MSQLLQPFNPMDFDPESGGAGGLPVGDHIVRATAVEIKPASSGESGMVVFTLEVIDGEARGATGAYRLNLYHPNETTVKIANSQLSALCYVTGVFQLGSDGRQLSALLNIPFKVHVEPQKDKPQYTEVKYVMDVHGNKPKKGGNGGGAPAGNAGGFGGQQQQQQQGGQFNQQQQGGGFGGQQQQPNQGGWNQQQGAPQGAQQQAGGWGGQQGGQNAPQQPQGGQQGGGWGNQQQGGGQQQQQGGGWGQGGPGSGQPAAWGGQR
jgi:hypothetical protein